MSFTREELFGLLPAIDRLRDTGGTAPFPVNPTPDALREFIEVLAEQVGVLEEELEQLYENNFVETAAPWALPYLGDLIGLRDLGGAGHTVQFTPRAEVANTLGYRRRKGTAAMLEQLARDISGRPAAAVEFLQKLATTQHWNHVRLKAPAWGSVRDARTLEFIGSPFEAAHRTVEVRRVEPGLGRWNIPNVGLFLWQLHDYRHTSVPLTPAAGFGDGRHFRLHPLGLDVQLCARPTTEADISHLATTENTPQPLTWRQMAGDPAAHCTNQFNPDEKWYGSKLADGGWDEKSILLWEEMAGGEVDGITADRIVICDLHDVLTGSAITAWGHDAPLPSPPTVDHRNFIRLDPRRGRVVFPAAPAAGIFASYSALFPANLGGGEYARTTSFSNPTPVGHVVVQPPGAAPTGPASHPTVTAAIQALAGADAVIEIYDSGIYRETLPFLKANAAAIEVRAREERWPAIFPTAGFELRGDDSGTIALNGILFGGTGGIVVNDHLGTVIVRHCTVMPGLTIGADGRLDPAAARPVAVRVLAPQTNVTFENCILGPLRVAADVSVTLKNCIVDAGQRDANALSHNESDTPAGTWQIENSTIIGRVFLQHLDLASNTLFLGDKLEVQSRQEGCVRFCCLPDKAITPKQHKCIPRVDQADDGSDIVIDDSPQFSSLRFGDADFGLLSGLCPDSIRRGADDESEMGVYHDEFVATRENHLRARLREYLRFGLEAGLFHEGTRRCQPPPS